MSASPSPKLQRLALLLACASPAAAQGLGTLTSIAGQVVDLARETGTTGSFLYGTSAGAVGRIGTNAAVQNLGSGVVGVPGNALRAVVSLPDASVAALDNEGYVLRVQAPLPVVVYADLYMIQDATDLAVDANGTFAIASRTPSGGVRALNWVSSDGQRWAYYRIADQPLALAADPLGTGLLYSDAAGSAALRRVETSDPSHAAALLENLANPGCSVAALDGDLAVATSGDIYYAAGAKLWLHTRATGTSALVHNAGASVRGLCIAASSGGVASATGWSLYFAQGENPTLIRELGGAQAPAGALVTPLGTVPDRGKMVWSTGGMNVFELAADLDGHLLVGGDLWGANPQIRRLSLPSFANTTIASAAQGLVDRVEGLALDAQGRIVVQSFSGVVQRLVESPYALSTLYADPTDVLHGAKDVALTRAGSALIAERAGFGSGAIYELPAGAANLVPLVATVESRGIAVDPFGARALVTQWNNTAFAGTVDALSLAPVALAPLSGFAGMNYSNAASWADGDVVADAYGDLYTCSEDDWSVVRYARATGKLVRIGSGYLNHPAGLAIAASSGQTPSATGWSLYVAEWNFLWEIGGVPAPAPRLVDPFAPPVGRCAGFASPAHGEPRALCASADGGALYVVTALSRVLRVDPATRVVAEVAGPAQGLGGELAAIAPRPNGALVVAARDGRVWELATPSHAVSALYADAGNLLGDVRGACLDAQGRVAWVERPASGAARLLRLEAGLPQFLVHSARGLRAALDPLSGELWVSEQGALASGPFANAGELLRVDASLLPPRAGHLGQDLYTTLVQGDFDGGFAFDAGGDVYAAESGSGRVWKLRRDGGPRALVAGGYDAPRGVALALGTPGVAGPQGASAYVLDRWAIYEHGIAGTPAPLVPGSAPSGIELAVRGSAAPATAIPVAIARPQDAGLVYVILPTLSGKLPGLPLAWFGAPSDPRLLPLNLDALANFVGKPALMPGFVGALDGLGKSLPNAALVLPNSPSLLSLDAWIDFTWIALDASAPSGIATVGATAQLYLGP
ncbi:MAG: hypothetical protein EPO68_07495 [Planctomycetota bacterium]|nr:MAG: hypothetical protein EPO68_07495 [Planctomycetota bacterium]